MKEVRIFKYNDRKLGVEDQNEESLAAGGSAASASNPAGLNFTDSWRLDST